MLLNSITAEGCGFSLWLLAIRGLETLRAGVADAKVLRGIGQRSFLLLLLLR